MGRLARFAVVVMLVSVQAARADTMVNVADFSAKGDDHGDDTAAFEAAIGSISSTAVFNRRERSKVFFPCGIYNINKPISVDIAPAKSLTIAGEARTCVKLVFKGEAGTALTVKYGDEHSSFHLSDVTFTVDTDTDTSVGVDLEGKAGITNPAASSRSDFTRVTFRGSDGSLARQHWGTAVHTLLVSNIDFNQVDWFGGGASSKSVAQGISIEGKKGTSCRSSDCYVVGFNFDNNNFNGLDKSIALGYATQGTIINRTNWNAVNYGLYVPPGLSGVDGVTVTGTPGASAKKTNIAILSNQARDVIISNNYFVLHAAGSSGLDISGIGAIVQGNGFEGIIGHPLGPAVTLSEGATSSKISGNFYSQLSTGNALAAGTNANLVDGNIYSHVATPTTDLGSANTSIEQSSTLAGWLRVQNTTSDTGPALQLIGLGIKHAWNVGLVGSSQGAIAGSFWIYDATSRASRFVIDPSGNVGIGSNRTAAKLDVAGTLRGQVSKLASVPTASDIPSDYWTSVKRADDGSIKLCANDKGAVKCSYALSVSDVGRLDKLASPPSTPPGTGHAVIFMVAGTRSGTCKLQVMAGQSTTPATIIDNIGSGC